MTVNDTTVLDKSNPSNFQLVLPKLPIHTSLEEAKELTLNIYSTVLPGFSLGTIEENWLSHKITEHDGSITFEQFDVSFLVDSDFYNWKALAQWVFYINNNKDKVGEFAKNFQIDASLKIIDNFQRTILTVLYKNMWPISLGAVTLSYREGETSLESNVTFIYDRYEISS